MILHHLNFKYLKQNVSIATVLSDKGLLERFQKQGDRLVGPCPIHNGDNPTAFVVNLSKNIWHCFTGCNKGGDLIEFVRLHDDLPYPKIAEYLASLANITPSQPLSVHPSVNKIKIFRPFTMRLNLDHNTPWLKNKGILPETAQTFEAGRYLGAGFLADCIVVRLHDLNGLALGYAGRCLNPEQAEKYGKWKFPPGFPKSKTLYNFHRIRPYLKQSVVIVECPWGVMRLAQLNIPAIALLGTTLSSNLHDLLRNIPSIILMLDGDMAGQKATSTLYNSLKSITHVDYVLLPPNHDPDDLNDDTLRSILKCFSL